SISPAAVLSAGGRGAAGPRHCRAREGLPLARSEGAPAVPRGWRARPVEARRGPVPPRCTLRPAVCLALALAPSLPHWAAAREPLSSFADVLDRAEPAVVNIATVGRAEEAGEQETMQDFLHRFFGEGPRVQRSLG